MGKPRSHRHHGVQEVHDLLKGLDNLLAMSGSSTRAAERLTKANELARKAMQFAATGVNIREPVKRFIIELEARKDIPPKMLYGVFNLVAPWDQQIATMIAGLLAARCADLDATVRRASLQQLTSLRLPALADVMHAPIEAALGDASPAVRAAAVVAVLKVATLGDEAGAGLEPLWTRVDDLLREDESAEVLHACVAVKLHRQGEAALVRDRQLVEDLIARLQIFEPHQQASVLGLAKRYIPSEAPSTALGHPPPGVPEVGAFMDAVEPCLSSVYSATVLAAIDALLCWAKATGNEYWYSQALARIKRPLFALCRAADAEVALVALRHAALLVRQAPYAFADDVTQFFVRHADAPSVKLAKIDVLKHLAAEQNRLLLVSELMEYTKDRDTQASRAAVRALAHIVLTVEAPGLIESLLDLLSCGDAEIVSETVLMLRDIIRRYPDVAAPYAATLQALPVADLSQGDAAAAYFWIRAEIVSRDIDDADEVEPAPYVFEEFVEKWDSLTTVAKTELLFATARVALHRAPMTAPVLRAALIRGLTDADLGVMDVARLIRSAFGGGVETARALLASQPAATALTADDTSEELVQELMTEFDTLSVIYGRPARTFVEPRAYALLEVPAAGESGQGDSGDGEQAEGDAMEESQEAQLLDLGFDDNATTSMSIGFEDGAPNITEAREAGSAVDLLDGLGLSDGGAGSTLSDGGGVSFERSAAMDRGFFQENWARLESSSANASVRIALTDDKVAALMTQSAPDGASRPFADMFAVLERRNVHVFAEGPQGGFLFARRKGDGSPVFAQYGIEQDEGAGEARLSVTLRSSDHACTAALERVWREDIANYVNSSL